MATHVVGAGGIGCAIAASLIAEGEPVVIVEACAAKLAWGRTHGVHVNSSDYCPTSIHAFESWWPHPGDRVFLCVKCFDNAAVLERLPEGIELIPVQNGYDPQLERRDHAIEGIASFVAYCEPGTMRTTITRPGDLHFGPRLGNEAALRFASRLTGIKVNMIADIRPIKATKLMYNAAISPLAAAAGVDNGELLSAPLARTLFFALLRENYAILRSQPLGKVGPFHPRTVSRILRVPGLARLMAKFFVKSLRDTYCSMAGDIGGRTELENYTGHLLRLRPDAPCNRAVMDVVSTMTKPDRGVLEVLRRRFGERGTSAP